MELQIYQKPNVKFNPEDYVSEQVFSLKKMEQKCHDDFLQKIKLNGKINYFIQVTVVSI